MQSALMQGIARQELNTLEQLKEVRGEWRRLWECCPDATPFQSPEWVIGWWKHFGQGKLMTLALRHEDGLLAGIAPFFIHTAPNGERVLLLIGTRTSDYLDALIEPAARDVAAEEIFSFLDEESHRWDICDFQQLQPGAFLLKAPAPAGWRERVVRQETSLILRLPPNAQSLFRAIPKRQLRNLQYYERRVEMAGTIRAEQVDASQMDEFFENLRRFQILRRGQSAALNGEASLQFHHELVSELVQCGSVRLYALRSKERIIAVFYGFFFRHRAFYYLGGYDLEFARFSPGTLIVGHAIKEAAREGIGEFDFLRGCEPYKYLWGAREQSNFGRELRHAHSTENGVP